MSLLAVSLLCLASFAEGATVPPVLRPGDTAELEIGADAPEVTTAAVAARMASRRVALPMIGVDLALEVTDAGPYTIEARGIGCDPYLILRGTDGAVIAEDDNGYVALQARVVADLAADARLRLSVGAWRAQRGVVVVTCRAGRTEPLPAADRPAADVVEALACAADARARFGSNDLRTATAVLIAGRTQFLAGRAADAERSFSEALAVREKLLGEDDLFTAEAVHSLGLAMEWLQRLHDAELLWRRAHAIRVKVLGETNPDTAQSAQNIGSAMFRQGLYPDAETWFRRAMTARVTLFGDDNAESAASIDSVGTSLEGQARFAEAEEYTRRAYAIRKRLFGDEHPITAMSLDNMALLLLWQGRFAEAEEWARRAVLVREKVLGEKHTDTEKSVSNVVFALQNQERFEEAEPWARRALAIGEAVYGPDDPQTAWLLDRLATISAKRKQLVESEALMRRSLAIRERVIGEDAPLSIVGRANLGGVLTEAGRYAEAEVEIRRAIELEDRLTTHDAGSVVRYQGLLANVLEFEGRFTEAEPIRARELELAETTLGRTHRYTRNALAATVELQTRLHGADAAAARARDLVDRQLEFAKYEVLFSPIDLRASQTVALRESLFEMLSIQAAAERAGGLGAPETYAQVLAWKGICYRAGVAAREATADAATARQLDELRRRGRDVSSELSGLTHAASGGDLEQRAKRFADLEEERRGIDRRIMEVLGLHPDDQRTDAARIAALLPPDTALVDLVEWTPCRFPSGDEPETHGYDWQPPRIAAWITRPRDEPLAFVDLGPSAELKPLVESALSEPEFGLRGSPIRAKRATAADETARTRLRDALWEPLARHLQGVTRCFVCPDGFLAEFPFESLVDRTGHALLETTDVVYVQDPITLRELLERDPPARNSVPSLLAVGGVAYGESGEIAGAFEPLPETGREAERVAALVRARGEDTSIALLRATDATESAVKQIAAGRRILHLATHGFYQRGGITSVWAASAQAALSNADARKSTETLGVEAGGPSGEITRLEGVSPGLLTGIVLAGANRPAAETGEDGILTADEVERLELSQCDLAVLSACETALGQGTPGEGLMSLRRAFLAAGAKTVVSTLWRVHDEATRALIDEFYRRLLDERASPADALRGAKLHLLKETQWKEPRYWAAFTLAGDWR